MTTLATSRILAFVLAGGEGRRLRPLTTDDAKPAVRFADDCRIIDFAMANLVNSRVSPIYVLAQYKPRTLLQHLKGAWCPRWPVRALLPPTAQGYRGTADAVHCHLDLIERHRPAAVAVFAADQVYRMDVRQMFRFHTARDADVTVAALAVPVDRARRFGVMGVAADDVVTEFQEKPAAPRTLPGRRGFAYVSMGNYLFKPDSLCSVLEEVIADGGTDFGRDVLPAMLAGRFRVLAYDFASNQVPGIRAYEERAYWRDVGTVEALAEARRDAAGACPRIELSNPAWPLGPIGPVVAPDAAGTDHLTAGSPV